MDIETSSPHVFKLTGRVDISRADEIRNALVHYLQSASELSIDLSSVEVCDASGVQLLLAAHKSAQEAGKSFLISGGAGVFAQTCVELGISADMGKARPPR